MNVQNHIFNEKVVSLMKNLGDRELYVYLLITHKTQVFQVYMKNQNHEELKNAHDFDLKAVFTSLCEKGLLKDAGEVYHFEDNFEDATPVLDWTVPYLGQILKDLSIRELYLWFWSTVIEKNSQFSVTKEERTTLASGYRMPLPFINRIKLKEAEEGLVKKGYLKSVKYQGGKFVYILQGEVGNVQTF